MKERLEKPQALSKELMNRVLWFVIRNGDKPINGMLYAGADLHLSEYVVLINAAQYGGYKQIVEFLLINGANLNDKNNYGDTALIMAARRGHNEVVEMLLNKGANIEENNNNGTTALIATAVNGHKETIEILIKYKANVDRGIRGYTALMVAAQKGHKEVVEVLLENGANINKKSNTGYTALMLAAQNGHFDVAIVLIKNNPNINQASNDGKTAIELTSDENIKDLLSRVISYQNRIHKLRDTIVYCFAKAINGNPNYEQFRFIYNSRMMESNFLPKELKDEIVNYTFPVKPSNKLIVNPSRSKIDFWAAKIQTEQQRKELDKEGDVTTKK